MPDLTDAERLIIGRLDAFEAAQQRAADGLQFVRDVYYAREMPAPTPERIYTAEEAGIRLRYGCDPMHLPGGMSGVAARVMAQYEADGLLTGIDVKGIKGRAYTERAIRDLLKRLHGELPALAPKGSAVSADEVTGNPRRSMPHGQRPPKARVDLRA